MARYEVLTVFYSGDSNCFGDVRPFGLVKSFRLLKWS